MKRYVGAYLFFYLLILGIVYIFTSFGDVMHIFDVRKVEKMDTYDLLEYVSIYPDDTPKVGEDTLWLRSRSIVRRKIAIDWDDSLMCDINNDGEFSFFSRQKDSTGFSNPKIPPSIISSRWPYRSQLPKIAACCYIKSKQIVVDQDTGVTKDAIFDGDVFCFE